ncbi:uncharacterized protein LOC143584213 [Bidens hawaiensis]|uniref:uncharacterized protein LOC143584213 n=1 Tax=Bidens hawaiensis TaxID=980011 RepID=UPI00404AE1DC
MSKGPCLLFLLQLLVLLYLCKPVASSEEIEQSFPCIHRSLVEYLQTEFDSIDPPITALPTTPVTTAPGIITIPGTNPVTTPSTNPPTASGGYARGQSWCVAKNGASQVALQSALDYACGIGGADCATIQQGASCFEPATLQNHASYAFNSYYQKNPVPTSCDFGGAAAVTTTNPSTGSCVYPSSSSLSTPPPSTSSPTPPITQTPVNPTYMPAAPSTSLPSAGSTLPGAQSPPQGFSFGNPDPNGLGTFGASPPLVNTAAVVLSYNRLGSVMVVVLASIIMFGC